MKTISSWHVFKQLLYTDFCILRQTLLDQIFNMTIWVSANLLVCAYLLPSFGLSESYGNFILAGLCASAGLFGVFPNVANIVNDFENDRLIDYSLTLPIYPYLIFIRSIIFYACSFSLLGLVVLPIGKILLWKSFTLTTIHWFKLIIIFILLHLFYGALTLWTASRVKNMLKIGNVWMRFVFPIWFLGGFQFSWSVMYKTIPALGYLNLLNPITYGMEGMRAAILGQEGFLNFWLCTCMLIIFIIICSWRAIVRLQRRLDFL